MRLYFGFTKGIMIKRLAILDFDSYFLKKMIKPNGKLYNQNAAEICLSFWVFDQPSKL
jgi:hypothetical protein